MAGVRHIPAQRVETMETTGCGDVFHGAYAASLARGADVESALRFASTSAAVYASRPTGWEYLPSAAEVEQLIKTGER
jgi:sulfofructose kinase